VKPPAPGTGVMFSAGLDSAVLLAHAVAQLPRAAADAAAGPQGPATSDVAGRVTPIYVRAGLAWEPNELAAADRVLASGAYGSGLMPLVSLQMDMRDVYPASHWAVRGTAPGYDTPDEDVYIQGRNIVLLSKAAVYMARTGIDRVLIGPLAGNPFPDATPAFFDALARTLSIGLATPIAIEAPLLSFRKADVIRLGRALRVPLELTLSCMQPVDGAHCGACSKCRERIEAFREAGGEDPTRYVQAPAGR
jgi:7-cyano-7-deazaguanine synthase